MTNGSKNRAMTFDAAVTSDSYVNDNGSKNRAMTFDAAVTSDSYVNDNGHLVVSAYLSRPGVFDYLASEIKPQWPDNADVQRYDDDAVLRAYRSADAVSNDTYLQSARFVPVTDDHPPVMMHPNTVEGYPVGTSTNVVVMDQGRPKAQLVLWDKRAIQAREQGKREISVGAYNRFVWGPGTTDEGQPYDFRIEDSTINHIAIVEYGRAGRGVKILDREPKALPITTDEGTKTMKVSFGGGATYDIDDNAAKLLSKERAEQKKTNDALSDEVEVLKARKPAPTDAELRVLVDAEVEARRASAEMEEIRQKVFDAGCEIEGKSDDRVRGMYEMVKRGVPSVDKVVKIRATTEAPTFDRASAKRALYGTV